MNLVPAGIARRVATATLKSKKNAPHVFFGLGLSAVVGGTYLACRATLKLSDVVDETSDDIKEVKNLTEQKAKIVKREQQPEEYYKDLGYVYGVGIARIAKLYAPAVIVTGAGIVALTGSHVTLTRRNAALTMTLGTVLSAFEEYRGRVRSELGQEKEQQLYHGIEYRTVEDEENGEEKTVKSLVGDPPYARLFDESCCAWEPYPGVNQLFAKCQQDYFNGVLRRRGHVFLNEIYDVFGMERTPAGAVVGWVWHGDGDNFIDFGLEEVHNRTFTIGQDPVGLIDFNVDGVIYDKI